MIGYSRDSFYRIKELYDTAAKLLFRKLAGESHISKNRVDRAIEEPSSRWPLDFPALVNPGACNELRKQGIFISAGGVRSVWLRHDLEVFDKRLKRLEARIAKEGLILTEAQLIAMERKKRSGSPLEK